ncbi:alpha/beta-hydrolase [Polychaeton citri CBS 116435]|uniref:Alpha/beta-hydrolase n=1 Tax=Polychaeton citri CBS 116435 TaxID=1314669 RepID=A0A9P4PX79_9PEZI|nr:alpha/beta-hydrolase [Polychaeton citri CBS 116435]
MPQIETSDGTTLNFRLDHPPVSKPDLPQNTLISDLLVIVGGLSDDIATWDLQVPAFLSAGYSVLRYDHRGVGESSRPRGPYTAGLLAQDLRQLLTTLEINKFHLLGMSMGGCITIAYSLAYPNSSDTRSSDVEPTMLSLLLCATYMAPSPFCDRLFACWAEVAKSMGLKALLREVTLWCFTLAFFREREAELKDFESGCGGLALLNMGVEGYLAQLNVCQSFDCVEELSRLRMEGKVLGGLRQSQVQVLIPEEDCLIPVALQRELADELVGAGVVATKGGHGCQWEFPNETNASILGMLNRVQDGV